MTNREPKFNPTQALFFSITYAFGCYFLLPPGWKMFGTLGFFLFGALLLCKSPLLKLSAVILLFAAISISHSYASPDARILGLYHQDTVELVYILEFLGSSLVALVLVIIDFFGKSWRVSWEHPAVWILGFFFIWFLLVPQDIRYKFAFGFNFPFVIAAYKCKSAMFRWICFACLLVSGVIIFRIFSGSLNGLRTPFTMYGEVVIAFCAWFVWLGYKSFGEQERA